MRFLRALLVPLLLGPVLHAGEAPPAPAVPLPDGLYAEFVTPRGPVIAELFYRQVPLTVASFTGLAEGTLGMKKGTPFFDGLKFHRVVPDFVVQGGDPLGTGEGGPGYAFADEFVPGLRHDDAGMLSMANGGPDTNGSQFFFTLREVNRLNYLHSVFGRVVRGREILPLIRQNDVITAVRIRRVGAAAIAFRADQAAFDTLAAHTRKFAASPTPGPAATFDDPDRLLPSDPPRALIDQRKLANFERATGRKIYARLCARFVPETPNQRPGSLAGAMAKKIGLPPASVLAVYFADTGQWGLWIGDDYLPQFAGRPGPLSELMKNGGLHQAKQDFLAAAKTRADLATADFARSRPPDQPLTAGQKISFQVNAVLDALILKFEPRP